MQTFRIENSGKNWRIDDDGFLRVTVRVARAGVYEYDGDRSDVAIQKPPPTRVVFGPDAAEQ